MDDACPKTSLPDDPRELKRLLAARERTIAAQTTTIARHESLLTEQQRKITTLTKQRDNYYIEKLRLEVRLAKALKQAYGPRADRVVNPAQMLLAFGQELEALPVQPADLPEVEKDEKKASKRRVSRKVRSRGRRDIGQLDHLPLIEQVYELDEDLCRCPGCEKNRRKIGTEISYTIEFMPASFMRIRHVQHKYACPDCERNGHNPNITLAAKTNGSPIDKGLPGPGLLAYVATAKFADYLPLHRLQHIFAREGFELDRSTMCLWMADVARLVRPLYDRMAQRVREAHVLATDDTVMPLLQAKKTKKARMWIYQGDESHPYNVFDFTHGRGRDGPAQFLKEFRGTLLADAYGGYDGVVLNQELPRAGCWAHARRKFVDAQPTAPELTQTILRYIKALFDLEADLKDASAEERLRRRQENAAPVVESLHGLLLDQKAQLLPKHPLAEAIAYVLNQWKELTLFVTDGAVPIHNNLAEQQMKRIALLRKNALFVGTERGGQTAAILSSITSTCRRHGINPQTYLTQLLANLSDTPAGELDNWLPDKWKQAATAATKAAEAATPELPTTSSPPAS